MYQGVEAYPRWGAASLLIHTSLLFQSFTSRDGCSGERVFTKVTRCSCFRAILFSRWKKLWVMGLDAYSVGDGRRPIRRTKFAALFAWNGGQSILLQGVGVVVVWGFVLTLHLHNNGLWYQGDSPRHAGNGVFWWDFLLHFPVNPFTFALEYFARYPVIAPTIYPPVFYLLEGGAFSIFGISPFVAKGLVLVFVLVAAFYMVLWLRQAVHPEAGWGGVVLLLQPGVITWSNAIMLNVPAMTLGLATLYHGRQLLDQPRSRQLYLVAVFGVLAILTYLPAAVIAFVLLAWIIVERCGAIFRQPRAWLVVGLAALALAPWTLITLKWAPIHVGMVSGSVFSTSLPVSEPWRWLSYLVGLPELFTYWVLALAAVGAVAGLWSCRWRREVKLALVWFIVCYVAYSSIAARELRYVLLLGPPLVFLSMVALVFGAERLALTFGANIRRVELAGLGIFIGLHLLAATQVVVPAMRGMEEIVAFLEGVAPDQRVFYGGKFDGAFSFYTRAHDQNLTRSVTLDSKLLYATAMDPSIGIVEMVASPHDVVEAFRVRCGCRWLAVESERDGNEVSGVRYLREALRGPEFELVRSFPFEGPPPAPARVDVYRFKLPIEMQERQQQLQFPIIGDENVYRVKPIDH
jgi:dolichyl-phosphate-mannose-protein mannosyltransferase